MSLKKHYSEKARLLNDKAVEKVANTEGNYIANNWYGEWETGGAVWFDYSLETGKWMEAYSKLVNGSPASVEIQTVPLTDGTDLNEIEQLINAGLAYYTDNPHLCISISPKALNPDPFTPIATKFDFINLFPLEPENISVATPAKHAIDTDNDPQNATDNNTAKSANTGATKPADTTSNEPKNTTGNAPIDKSDTAKPANTEKPTDNTDKSNATDSNPANANGDTAKPIDKPVNTGNKTDVTSPASKPADDTDNATPKTTTNASKPNVTTADNEPKASSTDTNSKSNATDSDHNSAKTASDNEPIDTGKTADKIANTGTDNAPVNNSSTSTAKPTDNGSKADDTTPKTDNAVPENTDSAKPTPAPVKTTDKTSTTDTDSIKTTDKSTTTPTSTPDTTDNGTPAPKVSTTDDKPSTTNATPKTTDSEPKTTGDKSENSTTGNTTPTAKATDTTPTDSTKTADTNSNTSSPASPSTTDTDTTPKTTDSKPQTTAKPADTEPKTNNATPLDPPTITDVYQPVTPLYSQDGSLPTPPSNTIDQLLNVLMAQGVFSNDTVLSGTLQDFGVTTGGATQWANAGNQQIGSGYMGQLWFTPFGQQTITDLSNNGYIWTDTTGTDYGDDDDALITFNSVTTEQSPIAGVMENTEWVKGTTWEQIPKTEIPFKTLSADSLLCQMIQSGNVILWKKNVKPNGTDMIAALPTQTFTDYLGNKWTAPLAN